VATPKTSKGKFHWRQTPRFGSTEWLEENQAPPAGQMTAPSMSDPVSAYDVIWKALRPGRWLVHCHIPRQTTNNDLEQDGGGGLMMVLEVKSRNAQNHTTDGLAPVA
jgi:hypothetical protein